MQDASLSEPGKLLLLAGLLAKDRIISNNAKGFLKELILRRDPRLPKLLKHFEAKHTGDNSFMDQIHELIQDESQTVYDELFSDTSLEVGKTLSKEERDRMDLNGEKSLIYGEVDYRSFYRVLRKINPEPGLVFYDLGSGTGKAVFLARFTQDFSRCIGIEILPSLHQQAKVIVERYNNDFRPLLSSAQVQQAAVYQGSFLDFDWSDGDVVFANSTCFDDKLMMEMSAKAEDLKPGSIVITFTKGLTSKKFEVLERKRYRMSWGPATVYIHRRLRPDGKPVGPPRLNILPSDSIDYDSQESANNEKEEKRSEPRAEDSSPTKTFSDDEEEEASDGNDYDEEAESEESEEEEEEEEEAGDEDYEEDSEPANSESTEEDEDDQWIITGHEKELPPQTVVPAESADDQDDYLDGAARQALESSLPPVPNNFVRRPAKEGQADGSTKSPSSGLSLQYPPTPPPRAADFGSASDMAYARSSPRSFPANLDSSWLNSPQDSALLKRKGHRPANLH